MTLGSTTKQANFHEKVRVARQRGSIQFMPPASHSSGIDHQQAVS